MVSEYSTLLLLLWSPAQCQCLWQTHTCTTCTSAGKNLGLQDKNKRSLVSAAHWPHPSGRRSSSSGIGKLIASYGDTRRMLWPVRD